MTGWRVNKSEVVGGGKHHHGSVFKALVPLQCDGCARLMQVGEEFTRGGRGTVRDAAARCWGNQRIVCRACGQREAEGEKASGEEEAGHQAFS